jgi:Fe-S cluster assembly protein SufD
MPTLEITADDVTCSHGAVVSDIDENSLFYMRSRGVEREIARLMLIDAFVSAVVERVQDKQTLERVREKVRTVLPEEDRPRGSASFTSI